MRRLLPLLAVLALAAACSSGGSTRAATTTTTAPVPAALADFLRQVKAPGSVAFTATYHVIKKLGGTEADVTVTATPPTFEVRAGDVVVHGPGASTADEARLSPSGVFSTFFSTGPVHELETVSGRAMANPPIFSERTSAGVTMRCVGVPQAGVVATTACLTPDGVFGYLDDVSVRFELTAYRATAAR